MHNKSADKEDQLGSSELKGSKTPRLVLQDVRILVVEDEFIIALDLQDFLESHGAVVVGPVATLERALELAKREHFVCAILDVHISGANVFPVAKLLGKRGIPFLFHTGHGDAQALHRDWPGCEVLIKPIDYQRALSLLVKMAKPLVPTRH